MRATPDFANVPGAEPLRPRSPSEGERGPGIGVGRVRGTRSGSS